MAAAQPGAAVLHKYASGQAQVARVGQSVRDFLGEGAIIKRFDAEGFVAVSAKGTRRFRMDFEGHGFSPHGHIEVLNAKGRWFDAGAEHHYYFEGAGK